MVLASWEEAEAEYTTAMLLDVMNQPPRRSVPHARIRGPEGSEWTALRGRLGALLIQPGNTATAPLRTAPPARPLESAND